MSTPTKNGLWETEISSARLDEYPGTRTKATFGENRTTEDIIKAIHEQNAQVLTDAVDDLLHGGPSKMDCSEAVVTAASDFVNDLKRLGEEGPLTVEMQYHVLNPFHAGVTCSRGGTTISGRNPDHYQ